MSQLGSPAAAAVEAAPMRNECEENLFVLRWRGESQDFMKKFSLLRVRNVPLSNLNKGPGEFPQHCRKNHIADRAHMGVFVGAITSTRPCRKGSTFDVLIRTFKLESIPILMSETRRVQPGKKQFGKNAVNSDA